MLKIKLKKIITLCLSAALAIVTVSETAIASGRTAAQENEQEIAPASDYQMQSRYRYRAYSSDYQDVPDAAVEKSVAPNGQKSDLSYGDTFTGELEIPEDGKYILCLSYTNKSTQDITLKICIDGESPFYEAERMIFPSYWVNSDEEWQNDQTNQYAPKQVGFTESISSMACDYSGENENPFKFVLSAGRHSVTATVVSGEFKLDGMAFLPPEQSQPYQSPQSNETLDVVPVVIEGESAQLKNNRALIPLSDSSSPLVHPSSAEYSKMNYIGGSNWSNPGQTISWSITVPKSGYYSIGFNFRQNQNVGGVSYRSLRIDGKLPFSEAARIKFAYGSSWQYMTYNGVGTPYYIYLKDGTHNLSLTATPGSLSELYSDMQDVTAYMGDIYVDITKVVGETVDIYRSYELFNQIPDFNGKLQEVKTRLEGVEKQILAVQDNKTSSAVSIVRDAIRVVNQMIDKPYSAHKFKSQYYSSYTNLSSLLADMVDMPLDIDRIVLSGMNSKYAYDNNDVSFGRKVNFAFKRFMMTFSADYSTLSDDNGTGEALTIWVNWGRDQAQSFNSIIQDEFVRNYKIPVNVSLANASLINAILAGAGPDCLIQMSRTEPVNLAMRGALVDLTQFDDFSEVTERFHEEAILPYTYCGGAYALPLTQGFYMMFSRTDILDSLGIKIPETWDEFININAILQRNNLQAVIPYTQLSGSGTVNEGVGGLTLYPTLLLQNGLPLYNPDGTASTLTQIKQIQTFVDWTDLYTKYKFQEIADFYNRFRMGSAPIGIAPYSLYTQLKATAPEIDGRWKISVIPGTVQSDGTVNHTSAGWGAGCAITKLSRNPERAWQFLKWWTCAETQLKYSNMLESVLGPLGRVSTANTEALSQMDWDAEMYGQITRQQKLTEEIPEIPGGYYTARGIDQAFWNVVEAGKDPTEMIKKWGTVVDAEIARKEAEYESR